MIGKAINFTGTPNTNDVKLYADDEVAETDVSTRDLGTSMNVDDLELEVRAKILGHTYTEAAEDGSTPEEMEIGDNDVAPYLGVGFYQRRRKNSITSFVGIWLYKVQHKETTINAETKGESINFQTATIEGTAYPVTITDEKGNTRTALGKKAVFTTEVAAKAWLNGLANIAAEAS